jgi:hypothetical protein
MPSNIPSVKDEELLVWLNSHADQFLDPKDKIEFLVYLTNTIKNDPNTSGLGIAFDHKFEIQPKAFFVTTDTQGNKNFGIVEISTSAIGLKDVGILHTYAKMVEPKYALLLCEKSFSKELTYLLTDPNIYPRLMEYASGRKLTLLDFIK